MTPVNKVYDPQSFEPKWRQEWSKNKTNKTSNAPKKPVYVLGMFPYPSGEGLHTGHVRIYTATDVLARFLRMQGYDVLYPMGWDAFGLPAENAAIKAKTNPKKLVPINEANFKRQLEAVGASYDWERAFSTTDPDYYRWTQWLFLKLYSQKNKKGERLVYRQEVSINWCPFCKTGIANEEVLPDGTHERCGTPIEQKNLPQWLMRITDYADPLLYDLDTFEWEGENGEKHVGLDWPKGILEQQRNWIGRKEGIKVKFALNVPGQKPRKHGVEIFTTRLDTIFGVSFVAVSPELALKWLEVGWAASEEVKSYIGRSLKKLEQQRLEEARDKTGIETGVFAVNPLNGEKIPVYVADYVLGSVGTGAIMGVPAHDQRDFEFASKHNLPIKEVIKRPFKLKLPTKDITIFEADGLLINSSQFDGLSSTDAREKMFEVLRKQGLAEKQVTYHLRDWVFSRQRYWGEPIPLVYCDKCGDENGVVPVSEDQLPLTLPDLESYEPSGTGESPLSSATDWVNTTCPQCGGTAKRETDTMPNWAGSCWYFLRFADPKNNKKAWSDDALDTWLPVDWYLGGAEHAVLHLLYARFWVKAFADLGLLNFKEPFLRLRSVGMVLAEDGRKMSKSLGNVVNPDSVIEKYGADALRIYELFMGPWDQAIAWETRSLVGCYRFLEKVWKLSHLTLAKPVDKSEEKLADRLNLLLSKIGRDITLLKFNTAVAASMEFANAWQKSKTGLSLPDLERLLLALAPIAPFITEELYRSLGHKDSIHQAGWPEATQVVASEVLVVVQVNGKLRDTMEFDVRSAQDEAKVTQVALASPKVNKHIQTPKKVIFVPGKLINLVG